MSSDILDYEYAVKNKMIPEDYKVWWGYEDEKLFGFAKEKLLSAMNQIDRKMTENQSRSGK